MDKKYKELPAFETNGFKVGDRIRVYGWVQMHHLPYIARSGGDGIVMWNEDPRGPHVKFENDEAHYSTDFKQCRKLEEVKPREFWLPRESLESLFEKKFIDSYGKEKLCDRYMTFISRTMHDKDYIKVREVINDE